MSPLINAASSAIWIGATIASFLLCRALYQRLRHTLLNPMLWATASVVLLVVLTGHSRQAFHAETQPLVWLLGPAVVALARPVWLQRRVIALNWCLFGGVVGASLLLSVAAVLLLPPLLGPDLARALSVKSVTAPVALGIAHQSGLSSELVVVAVMTSALFGMVLGPAMLGALGLKGDTPAVGAALGCASHGLGVARAHEIGQTAGAFASVSMGLSAIAYGVLLPFLLKVI